MLLSTKFTSQNKQGSVTQEHSAKLARLSQCQLQNYGIAETNNP